MDEAVSVIIPAFNAERFLSATLDSAQKQSVPPAEIIVVDDGSTDATADIAKHFQVRYIHKANEGISSARNTGLRAARGDYISFIDADDLWPADKLERQLAHVRANPDFGIVLGMIQTIDAEGNPLDEAFYIPHLGTALIKRSVIDKVGYFDTSLAQAEDSDWFFRAMETDICISVLENVLLFYRRHQNNITANPQLSRAYWMKAIHMSLQRRRNSGGSMPKALNMPELPDSIKQPLIAHIGQRHD